MYTKYKILTGSLALLMCFGTTGCGKQYSLNEEHNELLAEYAANAILQSNPEYKDKLVALTTEEVTTQAVEITTEEPSVSDTQISDTKLVTSEADATTEEKNSVTDLSDLFSDQKLTVLYKGYKVVSQYSDNNQSSSSVEAQKGNKLLICRFKVKNNASAKNHVDLLDSSISYQLHIGDGSIDPMLTLLEDDLALYQGTFKKGESKELLLLFEVPNDTLDNIDYLLEVSNHSHTVTVTVH